MKCADQWIDLYLGKDILLHEMKNRGCYYDDGSGEKSNKKEKARKEKVYIRFYRDVSCELKDRISMIFFSKRQLNAVCSFCAVPLRAFVQCRRIRNIDLIYDSICSIKFLFSFPFQNVYLIIPLRL